MKRIIFLFFIISFIECLYYKDLCFPDEKKEFKCFGRLNYNCGDFVCTKNQYTCHILSIFSARKFYESFVKKIKSCPEPLEKNGVQMMSARILNNVKSLLFIDYGLFK